MLTAVLLALALLGGAHPLAVLLIGVAVVQPVLFLVAAAAWALYHARRRTAQRRVIPAVEAD